MIQAINLFLLEEQLKKGLDKARETFPEFEVVELGLYRVKGSKGNWYEIRAGRTVDESFFIACTCRGALQGHGCYHAAVVYIIHKREVKKRIEAREKVKPEDAPYFSGGENKSENKPKQIGNFRV